MEHKTNKGFTFTAGKGRIYGLIAMMFAVMLLAGCSNNVSEINSSTPGFFNHYIVFPLSYLIQHIASAFNGSYGVAIIIITLVIRLALLPLMMRQAKSQQGTRVIMNAMKPELDALKKKYEGKNDAADRQKLSEETMALYKKHKFNPLNIGCLPLLIQLPILSGIYTAIRLTPELSSHSFLWFKLGAPDYVLAVVVAVIYLIQAKISQANMAPEQRKQFAIMGYISPLMMAFFSLSAPAAMPLYWTVGGSFLVLQTLLFRKLYPVEHPQEAAVVSQTTAKKDHKPVSKSKKNASSDKNATSSKRGAKPAKS
ncbi:membrane protein insertase YidC [Paenibacillus silvae]|uniref:membrane protein insertase YidC n=1 Tax=Paenibacillus silvae TaxID=1325358 RepID=UPI002006074C|nr:membrane protein insertase YidC [Paenibacillus silvae]MCK6073711.1 membrane protein insertase YidC [Paenibacillus silvae]MCK6148812.1 membrane protein insertase YidC [Paenibacillus silvae]MCK6267113.1 membrane protein insertase YidC [Paenibacillus silvae]